MAKSHTPGPWVFDAKNVGHAFGNQYGIYSHPDSQGWAGPTVANVPVESSGRVPVDEEQSKANAEFIVRAVNAHDALLAAARDGLLNLEDGVAADCPYCDGEGSWDESPHRPPRLVAVRHRKGCPILGLRAAIALAEPEPQPPVPEPIDGQVHEPGAERVP